MLTCCNMAPRSLRFMKIRTVFTKAVLVIALSSATSLFAQQSGITHAAKPESGFYIEATPTFSHVVGTGDNDDTTTDYFGAMIGFGGRYQLGKYAHKGQLDIGYLYHTENDTILDTQKAKFKSSIMPVLASYNFCVAFEDSLVGEWRIGPTVGAIWVKDSYEVKSAGYYGELKDYTYAVGVGTGFSLHLTKLLYLDIGYRYLRTGSISNKVNGVFLEKGEMQVHLATLTCGFKF